MDGFIVLLICFAVAFAAFVLGLVVGCVVERSDWRPREQEWVKELDIFQKTLDEYSCTLKDVRAKYDDLRRRHNSLVDYAVETEEPDYFAGSRGVEQARAGWFADTPPNLDDDQEVADDLDEEED